MSRGAPSTIEKLALPVAGTKFVDDGVPLAHRKKTGLTEAANYIRMLEHENDVLKLYSKQKLAEAKADNTRLRKEIADLKNILAVFIKEAGTEQFATDPATIDWVEKLQRKRVEYEHLTAEAREFFEATEYVVDKPKSRAKKDDAALSDDEAAKPVRKPRKTAAEKAAAEKPKTTRKPRKAAAPAEEVKDEVDDKDDVQDDVQDDLPPAKPKAAARTRAKPAAAAAADAEPFETPKPTRARRAPPASSLTKATPARTALSARKSAPAPEPSEYSESDADDFAIAH